MPTGDELIVEAKVSPADIAFIRVGQDAAIKFDAYDSGIYGSGKGKVIYISADTLSEMLGLISSNRMACSVASR